MGVSVARQLALIAVAVVVAVAVAPVLTKIGLAGVLHGSCNIWGNATAHVTTLVSFLWASLRGLRKRTVPLLRIANAEEPNAEEARPVNFFLRLTASKNCCLGHTC